MHRSELAYDILNVALSLCSVLNFNRKGAIPALSCCWSEAVDVLLVVEVSC
jgi:hypothetical protein